MAAFDIATKATGPEELVVRLSGELDLVSRPGVVEQTTKAVGDVPALERLVVELAGVTFCDSSGLGTLLDISRLVTDQGAVMVLRDMPPAVSRLLDISRLVTDQGAVMVLRDMPPAVSRLLDLAGVDDVLSRE